MSRSQHLDLNFMEYVIRDKGERLAISTDEGERRQLRMEIQRARFLIAEQIGQGQEDTTVMEFESYIEGNGDEPMPVTVVIDHAEPEVPAKLTGHPDTWAPAEGGEIEWHLEPRAAEKDMTEADEQRITEECRRWLEDDDVDGDLYGED